MVDPIMQEKNHFIFFISINVNVSRQGKIIKIMICQRNQIVFSETNSNNKSISVLSKTTHFLGLLKVVCPMPTLPMADDGYGSFLFFLR